MNRSRSKLRTFALLLALTGVLFRGLIPAGFMPAMGNDARSGALLVLCSGGQLRAAATAVPDTDGTIAQHAMDDCPFAAAASPVIPPAPFKLAAVNLEKSVKAINVSVAAPALFDRLRPPARGPPVFS